MTRYCSNKSRGWTNSFMRVSRLLFLLIIGPLAYFIFMALILDGYFETMPRYIYCYPNKAYSTPMPDGNHTNPNATDATTVMVLWGCSNTTMDACSCALTANEADAESGHREIQAVLSPGVLRDIPLGFVPGSVVTDSGEDQVPWIGVIVVGFGFLVSLAFNVRERIKFISGTVRLDGIKAQHCGVLFARGPGACSLHLILVYLTLALVALFPEMGWGWRLLPLLVSSVYLGLGLFKLLSSFNHGLDPYGTITMVPLAAVSIFMEAQVPVAMSHLEGGLDQPWQISLTPLWILGILMVPACIITFVIIYCTVKDGRDDGLPRMGDMLGYSLFGAVASVFIATTLIMACVNENTWNDVQMESKYTWMQVMVPLMVLEGCYLGMLVVDFVGDRIVIATSWCQRLENKKLMYAKEAIERKKHVTGELFRGDACTGDYGSTSPSAGLSDNLYTDDLPHGAAPNVLASLQTLDNGTSGAGLMALSSLRNHLSNHPKERTHELKLRLLQVCRCKQEEGHWTKDHAAVLRELLPMFTELGEVLEQAQTSSLRTPDHMNKPQPPMQ